MMKKNFKESILSAACGVTVMAMILPIVGFAAARNNNATSTLGTGASGKSGFCLQVEKLSSKIDQRLTEREEKIKEAQTGRTQNFKDKRDNRDSELEQFREKWNANRDQFYAKLAEKADTNAKKQALEKFKVSVEAAVKTRRAAIDKAINDYRAAVDKLVASRKTAIDAAKVTYRNAIRSAFKNANDACAKNDVDPAKVREQLKADLGAARNKYQSDVQAAEKIGQSIQDLIKTRREAVAKAIEEFKTTLEKARVDLKEAWGTEGSSSGENNPLQ